MYSFLIRSGLVVMLFASAAAATFDKPIDKKVIALPADPLNARAKPQRSCFAYPGFVVKEIDLGEKGADELSIAPIKTGSPACTAKIAGEAILKGAEWAGYFLGAKGPFVFFNSDDGVNGGLPFAVYSAQTGKKLFEESRQGDAFKSVVLADGGLVMRYRRVWLAPCSLYADAKGCWQTIVAETSLSTRPNCTKAYQDEMARTPKFAKEIPRLRTVIAYNVEARYAGGKLVLKPEAGPAACWLED